MLDDGLWTSANSPNINPNAYAWDILGHSIRVNHPPPANLQQHEWQEISKTDLVILGTNEGTQQRISSESWGYAKYLTSVEAQNKKLTIFKIS